MKKVALINGPNLNLLGQREKSIYGEISLETIEADLKTSFAGSLEIRPFQSNHEGEIIDFIQGLMDWAAGLVFNPGAFTHTSVAIRDALLAVDLPCVEVHLSNIYAREEFRHSSLIAPICIGQISGFGAMAYHLGFLALTDHLDNREKKE